MAVDSLQQSQINGISSYNSLRYRTVPQLTSPRVKDASGDPCSQQIYALSQPLNNAAAEAQSSSFCEALNTSRRSICLGQSDVTPTPRNIYENQFNRSSPEFYGLQEIHPVHSSNSTTSTSRSYHGSDSVGHSALTNYSPASKFVALNRTLPRPSTLVGNSMPSVPQPMMAQFGSKVSSSYKKKHKCEICDKRFTRPSSLQTHMYSHNGEKPFICDVEDCRRQFSVVSNLRRHRKVHKKENNKELAEQ